MGEPAPVVVQGRPVQPGRGETSTTTTLDPSAGCPHLVQRVYSLGPEGVLTVVAEGGGECWYLGSGHLTAPGEQTIDVDGPTGIFLPAGARCEVQNRGPDVLEVTVVMLPEPAVYHEVLVSSLESCTVEVTGDREFRVLLGASQCFDAATQFVGDIPPGRAPEHSHTYDEVVRVLKGSGRVHAGGEVHPLAPGTSVYLPPGTPHCLENTSDEWMRVLGVFHPGGSPAAKAQHDEETERPVT